MSKIKNLVKRGQVHANHIRQNLTRVEYQSSAENIYHCCVHKTASQWVRSILSDARVYKYSGLKSYRYPVMEGDGADKRKVTARTFDKPFPQQMIISPIYIDYANYAAIEKPTAHKAFFVMRDPRDVMVSSYFSLRYSHVLIGEVAGHRQRLSELPKEDGFSYVIDYGRDFGTFDALSSWAAADDENVFLTKYEELTGPDNFHAFHRLFAHLDIGMPDAVLKQLLDEFSFERLTGGRKKGEENKQAHLRKGTPGDWKHHFDDQIMAKFEAVTGDLVARLGYT